MMSQKKNEKKWYSSTNITLIRRNNWLWKNILGARYVYVVTELL